MALGGEDLRGMLRTMLTIREFELKVAAPDTPVPFSPPLEEFFLPNEAKLIGAVKEIV